MSRKRDRWDSSSDDDADFRGGSGDGGAPQSSPSGNGANRRHPASGTAPTKFGVAAGATTTMTNGEDRTDDDGGGGGGDGAPSHERSSATGDDGHAGMHGRGRPSLPLHNPLLQGCRSVYDAYERLDRIDEGTYGIVWKARDTATDEIVALKQIKFHSDLTKEGFPVSALREISVLLALSHECIVTVREVVVGRGYDKVFMAMECMEMDLQSAIERSGGPQSPLPQSELKSMLHQLLSAVAHIHDRWYLHRDLKSSNILVHRSGRIAVCDFGLARKYHEPLRSYTHLVVTLWYRPPELLFGETKYGPAVDMWSVGCIFGELLTKKAMLQGEGELDQIDKIFKLLGAPTDETWPGFASLPNSKTFRWKSKEGSRLRETFPPNSFSGGQAFLDENGFDLLRGLLTMDPTKRITAAAALEHPYFRAGVALQKPRFQFDIPNS